ncbi:UDP-N-acetylmuramoyl-L-alanine--D-glutamate ligase [Sphingorhabdus sp. Alg239-R122]|uniref:UDP-N-acetylmuramoyl-L-alanine--D-glutamate ligase n=1 Tax=Sphingorhabdus sp. Alg239-R122 TaxID=2305989 RepID=UPI0013DAD11C|nr:UDP-N-acetylmuramoyl-L-alanine--D-glutamate ligase [Sphingorhabdus sp. Alg239-R122]
MITSLAFAHKKYALLGLARSGMATLDALVASGAHCMAWDNREEAREAAAGKAEIADPLTADLTGYDGIVVSPGVPINTHPIAQKAETSGVPLIGDIELFAQARAALPWHRVVGVTGTNGKSTTVALIYHILKEAGVPSLMGGNIGLPIMSQEPLADGGVYVLELSSYQIDITRTLDCEVAVLLNVTPDHLDRYDGFEDYAAAKARLFDMQSSGHNAIFGNGDDVTQGIAADVAAREQNPKVTRINADTLKGQDEWSSLQGPHNAENAAIAIATAEALGIGEEKWRPALGSFTGLPHRMERMAEHEGILFINDSKATNPASTAPALAAYTNIHWIVGGLPKGERLDECEPYFGNVKHAYTIGEAGPAYAKLLAQKGVAVDASEMLCTAVIQALENASSGDVIMLSPACASFDQFRDFEARGEHFRQIVNALINPDEDGEMPGPINGSANGEAA